MFVKERHTGANSNCQKNTPVAGGFCKTKFQLVGYRYVVGAFVLTCRLAAIYG